MPGIMESSMMRQLAASFLISIHIEQGIVVVQSNGNGRNPGV
jgi:hypothetical protein